MISQFQPADQLARLALERRDQLARYAAQHVPHYRELGTGGEFSRFPVLTRNALQEQNKQLLADGNRGPGQELRTSGSTGQVVAVWRDRVMQDVSTACAWRGDCWGAPIEPWDRELLMWGSPRGLNAGGAVRIRLSLFWRNSFMFQGYMFNASRTRALHRLLWRYRPQLLTSYPTNLLAFVRFARELGLKPPQLAKIMPVAEQCFEEDSAEIKNYFQAPVLGRYGSHELGCTAHQCEHGRWHLHGENVLLEVLNADGRIAAWGSGALLCTTLTNYLMPLIRYEIGDWAELTDELCPCGRGLPVLRELRGREGQFVFTPDGRWITSHGFLAPLRWYPVRDFRLVQDEPDRVRLLLSGARLDAAQQASLQRTYDRLHGGTLRVDIEHVSEIPPLPSGKRSRVLCQLPRPVNVRVE